MAVGVIIDAIAVRSLLMPALVALFGRLGMWPGHRNNVARLGVYPGGSSQSEPVLTLERWRVRYADCQHRHNARFEDRRWAAG
jgi:uncharacterized membrane protein YdfJ with MMPL/SSD domain